MQCDWSKIRLSFKSYLSISVILLDWFKYSTVLH